MPPWRGHTFGDEKGRQPAQQFIQREEHEEEREPKADGRNGAALAEQRHSGGSGLRRRRRRHLALRNTKSRDPGKPSASIGATSTGPMPPI